MYRGILEYNLFLIAITKSEFLPKAMQYMRSAVETFRKICPYSEKLTKKYEKLMERPEMDSNYMRIDNDQDNPNNVIEHFFSGLNL